MKIISGTLDFELNMDTAVALGKFDGLHMGHRKLLREILEKKKEGLAACVLTFDPSPAVFFGFSDGKEITTKEEKRAYLDSITGVALGSDAFFPFGDNIERAKRSGVTYIAEPGGSIRDDNVIEVCNKYNMAMAFTKMRLFHH